MLGHDDGADRLDHALGAQALTRREVAAGESPTRARQFEVRRVAALLQ